MDSESLKKAPTAAEEPPFSFPEVRSAHWIAQKRDPFFAGMDLQKFSQYMNQETGSQRYSAGDVSGLAKLATHYNDLVGGNDPNPVGEATGNIGASLGAL